MPLITLLSALILLLLLPMLFGHLLTSALLKLRLTPEAALLITLGIIVGSLINVPVTRVVRTEPVPIHPFGIFGLHGLWPSWRWVRRETIVAINVGGCVIPVALTVYELAHLLAEDPGMAGATVLAAMTNILVCYKLAQPVPGIGIAMPGLVPPTVAVLSALVLAPEARVPVAFIAGVIGPLIGADVLHLRDISRIATGLASIGGAGTFDGIVLSGILAAYLA